MMWKSLRGGATVIPGATFIPESRVGMWIRMSLQNGFEPIVCHGAFAEKSWVMITNMSDVRQ